MTAHARQGEQKRTHGAEQHDVLARHREDVQQPAASHVVDGAGGHALLVAQDHGLEHLAHGRTQASAYVTARRQAQPVDKAPEAATPPVEAQSGERRREHDVLAAPLEVAAVVEGARLGHRQSLDLGLKGQPRAFGQRSERGEAGRVGRAEVERQRRPFGHPPARH